MKNVIGTLVAALLIVTACGNAQERAALQARELTAQIAKIDSVWQLQPASAQEIIATYQTAEGLIKSKEAVLHTHNQCHYVWHCGEYMFKCRGKNSDIYDLPAHATELSLDDSIVADFITKEKKGKFTDHYFTLRAMKRGCSFDESRDGMTATVFFPIRTLNENDFEKLRCIFSSSNATLHNAYLERLKFPLGNSGCSEGLKSVQPLIEKNVSNSPLKSEILALFEAYTRIMPGMPAPVSTLKDTKGNELIFPQMRGCVIVIDVWATWCSSCIKNMPKFIGLAKEYEGRNDIRFATVSIDRSEEKEEWLSAIKRCGIDHLLNLFPDCEVQSQFETDYHISGIPRYIIIDKEGNIVSAYAPSEPSDLKELINKAL